MPPPPPNPLWPAYLSLCISILSIALTIVGWFVSHYLTQRRELAKDRRSQAEAEVARQQALADFTRLTPEQNEIITRCTDTDAPLRGTVMILSVAGWGSWVRAGQRDFINDQDPAVQARYFDAFESLLARGYFRAESPTTFRLTSRGYAQEKKQ